MPTFIGVLIYKQQANMLALLGIGLFILVGIILILITINRKIDVYQDRMVLRGVFKSETTYFKEIENIQHIKRATIQNGASYYYSHYFRLTVKNVLIDEIDFSFFSTLKDKSTFLRTIAIDNPNVVFDSVVESYKNGIDPGVEEKRTDFFSFIK